MNLDTAPPYVEIKTLFERREDFTVNTEKLRRAEFGQIARWLVTEKIDGTNIRVSLEYDDSKCWSEDMPSPHPRHECSEWVVRIGGRTNNAQVPPFLLEYLQQTFTLDRMTSLWKPENDGEIQPYPITLYGEGYGERIQKGGGNYRAGVSFRLFDVLVGGKWWLDWANVCDIAAGLGIKTVPMVASVMLQADIVDYVRGGFASYVANEERGQLHEAEGVVARTDPYLYDKHGSPLKFKLKARDFKRGKGE